MENASSSETGIPKIRVNLQVLYSDIVELEQGDLRRRVQAYDPSVENAVISVKQAPGGCSLGEVRWGPHAVQTLTFGVPLPEKFADLCIQSGQLDALTKEEARAHQAHTVLNYTGESDDISEQYIALALVAGALCGRSGVAVTNIVAGTAVAAALFTNEIGTTRLEWLQGMPPLLLFAGFVTTKIEDQPGIWMQTRALSRWGLPDLATLVESPDRAPEIYRIFSNAAAYMLDRGSILCAGHTMQIGEDTHMLLRDPHESEAVLAGDGELLVAEFIRSDQSNPYVFNT